MACNADPEFRRIYRKRLCQVRQQSKNIATRICSHVRQARRRQYSKAGKKDLALWREKQLITLQKQYENCLQEFGAAHRSAEEEPDPLIILKEISDRNIVQAKIRGKQASKWRRREEKSRELRSKKLKERRKAVRKLEDARAAVLIKDFSQKRPSRKKKTKKKKVTADIEKVSKSTSKKSTAKSTPKEFKSGSESISSKKTKKKKRKKVPVYINLKSPKSETSQLEQEEVKSESIISEILPISCICECESPLETIEATMESKEITEEDILPLVKYPYEQSLSLEEQSEMTETITESREIVERNILYAEMQKIEEEQLEIYEIIKIENSVQEVKVVKSDICEICLPCVEKKSTNKSITKTKDKKSADKIASRSKPTKKRSNIIVKKKKQKEKPEELKDEEKMLSQAPTFETIKCTKGETSTESEIKECVAQIANFPNDMSCPCEECIQNSKYKLKMQNIKVCEIPSNPLPYIPKTIVYLPECTCQPCQNKKVYNLKHIKTLETTVTIEKMDRASIEVHPGSERDEFSDYLESMEKREQISYERGVRALKKENIRKYYNELMKDLPIIQKQERLASKDNPAFHMSDRRLKQLERKRQIQIENVFEKFLYATQSQKSARVKMPVRKGSLPFKAVDVQEENTEDKNNPLWKNIDNTSDIVDSKCNATCLGPCATEAQKEDNQEIITQDATTQDNESEEKITTINDVSVQTDKQKEAEKIDKEVQEDRSIQKLPENQKTISLQTEKKVFWDPNLQKHKNQTNNDNQNNHESNNEMESKEKALYELLQRVRQQKQLLVKEISALPLTNSLENILKENKIPYQKTNTDINTKRCPLSDSARSYKTKIQRNNTEKRRKVSSSSTSSDNKSIPKRTKKCKCKCNKICKCQKKTVTSNF